MIKYDFQLMSSFVAFAEAQNIVEAAQRLNISQPALTVHLQRFESQFSHPIFQMMGRKKTLTPFGHEVYLQIKGRIDGLDDLIEQVVLKYGDSSQAQIRIAGRREVLSRIILKLPFQGQIIAIDCDPATGISLMLKSGLELLVVQEKPDSLNLIAKPLFQDQFQILVPKSMKLNTMTMGKKLIQQLNEQPFLSYKAEFPQREMLEKYYACDAQKRQVRIFSDWQTLIHLCENGIGWTLAPNSFSFDQKKCHQFLVPSSVIPLSQFYLIYPKNFSKIKWFSELISDIQKIFDPQ